MSRAAVFLTDGFEEIEALTAVDVLRRGQVRVTTISLTGHDKVLGKHGVPVCADALFEAEAGVEFDMLVTPGGTVAYAEHEGLLDLVRKYDAEGKKLAAICAAPAVFGKAGILKGRRAVCYPGMESWLEGATIGDEPVVTDGHITTSKGPATALPFALKLLEILEGPETSRKVAEDMLAPLIGIKV